MSCEALNSKLKKEICAIFCEAQRSVKYTINKSVGDFVNYRPVQNIHIQLEDVAVEYNSEYFLFENENKKLTVEKANEIFNDYFEKAMDLVDENLGEIVSYNKLNNLLNEIYSISERIKENLEKKVAEYE